MKAKIMPRDPDCFGELLNAFFGIKPHGDQVVGQSFDAFEVLFRDKIQGLPEHTMSMTVRLDIANALTPRLMLVRAAVGETGNLAIADGELVEIYESYRLTVFDGKVAATLEHSYSTRPCQP